MSEQGKIPTPKSQKELSRQLQIPYEPPSGAGGFSKRGNPNDAVSKLTDRANQISLKGDKVKTQYVGIIDIDEAILYYMNNVIKPQVIEKGKLVNVPISYTNGERWVQMQKEGYLRDKNGKLMIPFITFSRTDIQKNKSISTKIDSLLPYNYHFFERKYSTKNAYNNFDLLTNKKIEKEYHLVVVPDYITVTYEFIIVTHFMEQNNKIIEAINYSTDSYWGNPEKYKFKVMVDNFQTVTELPDAGERKIKTKFSLKLNGYLIPDVVQKDLNSFKKLFNKNITKITFGTENISS